MPEKAFHVTENFNALQQIIFLVDGLLKNVALARRFRHPDQPIMPTGDRLVLRVIRFIVGRLLARTNVVYMKAVDEDNADIAGGQWQS